MTLYLYLVLCRSSGFGDGFIINQSTNNQPNTMMMIVTVGVLVMMVMKVVEAKSQTFKVGEHPQNIAIDSDDNIWTTLQYVNDVVKLSNNGVILGRFKIAANDEYGPPLAVAIDGKNNAWITGTNTIL
jgi:streptogramin lyase